MQRRLFAPGYATSRNRLAAAIALPIVFGCASAPSGDAGAVRRSVAVYAGERSIDELDDTDLEDQPTFGLAYEWGSAESPLVWEVGVFTSEEDDRVLGFDVEAKTTELFAGARYAFPVGEGPFRPFVGGGLSWIEGELDMGMSDDDSSPGLYLHVGADWYLTDALFLGLDYRILRGTDIEVFDTDADVDYDQIALRLGYSF